MNFDTNNTIGGSAPKGTRRTSSPAESTQAPAADVAKPGAKSSADQVQLSQEAKQLGKLQEKIDSSSEVDMNKVNEIRRAIAEGKFHVNPERIADALLNQEELLG
jgi:negative regulator of flagellin synthesis FlgM